MALKGQLPGSVVPSPPDRARPDESGHSSDQIRRRAFRITTAWILVTIVCAGGLMVYRLQTPARIEASGDSYWYMRQALMLTGKSEPEASRISAELICADKNRVARALHQTPGCFSYDVSWVPQRYIRIFTSRPGYPLFAAPFVATLGAWHGMLAATVVLCLIAVVLAFLAVYLATGYRLAGFVAGVGLIALPSGFWMTRMLTEGGLMAGYAAVIAGALLTWRGRHRFGLTVVTLSLAWLFAVKSASGLAAAAVVAGASLIGVIGPRVQRRGPLLTGALGLGAVVLWTAFAGLTHQPGLDQTIQDFATNHFRKPDIPDPYGWLYRKNRAYLARSMAGAAESAEADDRILRGDDSADHQIAPGSGSLRLHRPGRAGHAGGAPISVPMGADELQPVADRRRGRGSRRRMGRRSRGSAPAPAPVSLDTYSFIRSGIVDLFAAAKDRLKPSERAP